MTELKLQQNQLHEYPQENTRCEWKEFKKQKNSKDIMMKVLTL